MSRQFIIDGYNLTNHPLFLQQAPKKIDDVRERLLSFIKARRLTGSSRNSVVIVFDGFPDASWRKPDSAGIEVCFSRDVSADEKIKQILEKAENPKNAAVVSDDKEIGFFAKSLGSHWLRVEEFIPTFRQNRRKSGFRPTGNLKLKRWRGSIGRPKNNKEQDLKPELSFAEMERVNRELRKIWLE